MSAVRGGGGVVQFEHFADKGERVVFIRCGRPHFFVLKTSDFSKFYVCQTCVSTNRERLSHGEHFADKGGAIFFLFCADVLYGRPLTRT